jgi:hypothetical protein
VYGELADDKISGTPNVFLVLCFLLFFVFVIIFITVIAFGAAWYYWSLYLDLSGPLEDESRGDHQQHGVRSARWVVTGGRVSLLPLGQLRMVAPEDGPLVQGQGRQDDTRRPHEKAQHSRRPHGNGLRWLAESNLIEP